MSYEKIYQDWEDSARQAHFIAENITFDIGKIHEAISKRPSNIMHPIRRIYMERDLAKLLGALAALGDMYVSPIQDLIRENS